MADQTQKKTNQELRAGKELNFTIENIELPDQIGSIQEDGQPHATIVDQDVTYDTMAGEAAFAAIPGLGHTDPLPNAGTARKT